MGDLTRLLQPLISMVESVGTLELTSPIVSYGPSLLRQLSIWYKDAGRGVNRRIQ